MSEAIRDEIGALIIPEVAKKIRSIEDAIATCRSGSTKSALLAAREALQHQQESQRAHHQVCMVLTDLVDAQLALKYASTPSAKATALSLLDEAMGKALPLRDLLDMPVKPREAT